MRNALAVLLAIAGMVCSAGCGDDPSNTHTTVYDVPASIAVPAPPAQALLGGSVQGKPLVLGAPATVGLFAGGSAGFSNLSSAGAATFNRPIAVTTDGTNLYVADYYNHAIRKINILTRHVTTIAGNLAGLAGSTDAIGTAASFNLPSAITTDGTYLYVTDSGSFTVRRIEISNGAVITLAGAAGLAGYVDAAVGPNARFNVLNGITINSSNLYVTDSGNTIRRIDLANNYAVSTLAGSPGTSGSDDGAQGAARFNLPARITTDGPNLYVTDFSNSTIRKIVLATGVVSTIAGKTGPGGAAGSHSDSTDGTGLTARFNQPNGITTDGSSLYVTDSYDNTVRKIVLSSATVYSGPVTTIATIGPASLSSTIGITTEGTSLFLTDFTVDALMHTIRNIQ